MAGLDRDWNRVVDGSQAAARALAGRALAAAHKRKPATREGSGPLSRPPAVSGTTPARTERRPVVGPANAGVLKHGRNGNPPRVNEGG